MPRSDRARPARRRIAAGTVRSIVEQKPACSREGRPPSRVRPGHVRRCRPDPRHQYLPRGLAGEYAARSAGLRLRFGRFGGSLRGQLYTRRSVDMASLPSFELLIAFQHEQPIAAAGPAAWIHSGLRAGPVTASTCGTLTPGSPTGSRQRRRSAWRCVPWSFLRSNRSGPRCGRARIRLTQRRRRALLPAERRRFNQPRDRRLEGRSPAALPQS